MDSNFLEIFSKAQNLHIRGFYEQALTLYSILLEKSFNYDVAINRGIAFLALNEAAQAVKDFDLAIQNDPTRYEAFFRKGNF